MDIKGIIFDINGTLIDINTNEWHDDVYRVLSNLLSYQGIALAPDDVKCNFFEIMKEQRAAGGDDRHREFDVIGIFRKIIAEHSSDFTRALPREKYEQLPLLLAEVHRAASRFRLQPYPGVEDTIRQLHSRYRLAVISDAQSPYALAELHAVGLSGYFDPIVISGDYGYRKPDLRLFSAALASMKMNPTEVLHVGNDMYRDVYAAQRLKIKTVFFKSNQGAQEREGVKPDYIIHRFPELLDAIRYFKDN